MNKRFSTLLVAFAAVTAVSTAQSFEGKFVQLQSAASGFPTLTWTKTNPLGVDSVAKTPLLDLDTNAKLDSSLWKVEKVGIEEVSGKGIYTFTNKATKQKLSFAKSETATHKIAAGVDRFTFEKTSGGTDSIIGASIGLNKMIYVSANAELATDAADAIKLTEEEVAPITLDEVIDLTGKMKTVKFAFAGKAANLFTETELIPTLGTETPDGLKTFKFQVVGKELRGEKDQFITIDTFSYSGNVKAPKFQLDTLAGVDKGSYGNKGNAALQSYVVMLDLGNDSISLLTAATVRYSDKGVYFVHAEKNGTDDVLFTVGYKTLSNSTEVLTSDNKEIAAPNITFTNGTPGKLVGGSGIYSLQLKSTGGYKVDENGKFLTYTTDAYKFNAAAAYVNAPYTQVYVKEHEDGTYSMQSRENNAITPVTADGKTTATAYADMLMTEQPIYKVGEATDLFALVLPGAGATVDTVKFTKLAVDEKDRSLGYRHFTKEEMSGSGFALKLVSPITDEIFLSKVDAFVVGSKVAYEEALHIRMNNGDINAAGDTVYYGASTLGDNLMRVSYSMEETYNKESKLYSKAAQYLRMQKAAIDSEDYNRYFFVANADKEGFVVVNTTEATINPAHSIVLNATTLKAAYDQTVASNKTAFTLETAPAPIYAKVAPGHYNVIKGYEMLTSNKGVAKFMREGDELKAGVTKDDLKLYIDSAFVNRGADNDKYGYYIYKGATVANDTIKGNALTLGKEGLFGVSNVVGDSAMFVATTVLADTIWYADKKPHLVNAAENKSVMMFRVTGEGEYIVTPMNAQSKTLAVVNDVVIFSNQVIAQPVVLKRQDAPTSNEEINANTIKVVAGEGNVTVYGAAGKKVVVSDVIGKTTTVIATSDSQIIAVTEGVVFVAVEGEATVKAVVK